MLRLTPSQPRYHLPPVVQRAQPAAPNLVGKISLMEKRHLLTRKPHPEDGRAIGLYLTAAGNQMMQQAENAATEIELEISSKLTVAEKKTFLRLLGKVYF